MKKFLGIMFALMCIALLSTQEAKSSGVPAHYDQYAICDDVGGVHSVYAVEQTVNNQISIQASTGLDSRAEMRCCEIVQYKDVSHSCVANDIFLQDNRISFDCPLTVICADNTFCVRLTYGTAILDYKPPMSSNLPPNIKV